MENIETGMGSLLSGIRTSELRVFANSKTGATYILDGKNESMEPLEVKIVNGNLVVNRVDISITALEDREEYTQITPSRLDGGD
jgi:hypothetical protein